MKLSRFGEQFGQRTGIVSLMDDLGTALSENPDMIFMGGGNPGRSPEVEPFFAERLQSVLNDPAQRHTLLGVYQSPQGDREFRRELAKLLRRQHGWAISERNVAVSNGSQSAFFVLFNLLAGNMPDGGQRSIHLPVAPEYIGYADAGLTRGFFTASRPEIELLEGDLFKYHVDMNALQMDDSMGALCVSRPTNPTGNVLTDEEIAHLDSVARAADIPLIIDGAYGQPFPGIVFTDAAPHWNENTVLLLSLSKLGLPGARTGSIVASEPLIEAYTNANTIVSLACGTLGPALAKTMLSNDDILTISERHIRPFYEHRAAQTVDWLRQDLAGLPFRIHKPEGAIFLWLWLQDLPITSKELYQRLKARGVLVVPGQEFFIGMDDEWDHQHQCLRISYGADADSVRAGVKLIAEEAKLAYEQAG